MTTLKTASVLNPLTIAPRSVHIHVEPKPMTLHERRGILRVLKDFGEVTLFRWLKDDPSRPASNVILAAFQSADVAKKFREDAPLEFIVEPPRPPQPNTSLATLDLLHPVEAKEEPLEDAEVKSQGREFHLTADVARTDLVGVIRRRQYYGAFEYSPKTFMEKDLAKNVPLTALSSISSRHEVPQRIVNRSLAKIYERKTLKQIWQEGQAKTPAAVR